ncbi:hypothetical protein HNP90_001880, partial [Methanococcus maripaludis]|nr:hypothetical protein [Methanococcus maripaludis]MBA2862980.1 hypothetical protein [Methanococcus maripaludis]
PPAKDMDGRKKRLDAIESGELQGYDWWFCYTDLKE